MAVAPARRVALLGGGFSTDDDGLLDDWLLAQVSGPRPKVCLVPTASGDAPAYVERSSSGELRQLPWSAAELPQFS